MKKGGSNTETDRQTAQENSEPQLSSSEEPVPSNGSSESPVSEEPSLPEEVTAPSIFRTLIAERRRLSSSVDKKLTRLEEFVEMNARFFFGGEDESKNQ